MKILFYSLVCMVLIVPMAFAGEIAAVQFNDMYQEGPIVMPLQGVGLKTVLFFKAFVAGYYTDTKSAADDLGEFAKRIEVQYFVNIPGKKLNDYTLERMQYNVTAETLAGLKPQTELMAKYFVDLKSGDRFALTYIPGTGTKFEHNGQVTGTVQGSVFAKSLFAVWIGAKPFDEALKQQILGGPKLAEADVKMPDITPGYVSNIMPFGPQETAMSGSIKYSVIGTYKAHFNAFTGSIAVDDTAQMIQSVILNINADSIESDCSWCDKIVRSSRLLNTKQNPMITFKSNDIAKDTDGYFVAGILEMNGIAKPMKFPFRFDRVKDPKTGQVLWDVSGKWRINRKEFNIIWNALLDHGGVLVGDYIMVEWGIKVPLK